MRMTFIPLLVLCILFISGCGESTIKLPFELTEAEMNAYVIFQEDLDEKHLTKLDPISVAKLYVYSEYHNNNEVTYALYTQRNGHIGWTREEDLMISEKDRGTKQQLIEKFTHLDTGEFIKTSEFEGYIEFIPNEESDIKSGFQMIMNENDIWKVAFKPIQ